MKKKANTLSIVEIVKTFSTEHKAIEWMEEQIWNNKPICHHCGCLSGIKKAQSRKFAYWCTNCKKYFTVKMGTVMESSKIPAQKWLYAMYLVLTERKGVSSLQLSKQLGITQKSAWFLLGRIREDCKDDSVLSGEVEVDETYIGGLESNKHLRKKSFLGSGTVGKAPILGIKQRGGKVKAIAIERTDKAALQNAIAVNVKSGSTVYTDEHKSYTNLEAQG